MTEEKPILDISTWTKVRLSDGAYVAIQDPDTGRMGWYSVRSLMEHYKVVDYQIRDGERTNPSGEPRP